MATGGGGAGAGPGPASGPAASGAGGRRGPGVRAMYGGVGYGGLCGVHASWVWDICMGCVHGGYGAGVWPWGSVGFVHRVLELDYIHGVVWGVCMGLLGSMGCVHRGCGAVWGLCIGILGLSILMGQYGMCVQGLWG